MVTLITNGAPTHEDGIKSLVGYLQANDVPVKAIYMNYCSILHKRLKEQILAIVKGSKLVGFSLMSKDVSIFMPIIQDIRYKLKIPVVLGGVHPTARPKESLEFSDYVCVGEGEEPLKQLYSAIQKESPSFNHIPNLVYKEKGGGIFVNRAEYFVNDLDELPYPDYRFETSYYYNYIRIEKITPAIRSNSFDSFYFYSQRGCKLACAYCSNSIYSKIAGDSGKRWYRLASVKRVINELKAHLQNFPRVKFLTFNDDDFMARDIGELRAITCFVKNELKLPFSVNGIPKYATAEKIKLLVDNGLRVIAFGVQSGSPRVLRDIYRRPVTREDVLQAAQVVAKYQKRGLSADYGFILDNPYEKNGEWLETLSLIRALPKPRTISLYSLEFFPGTALTNQAVKEALIDNPRPSDYNKDYRSDIEYSFKNTIFFLYSYFDVPEWLDSFLSSKFMMRSRSGAAFRFILAYPLGYLIRMSQRVAAANRETFFLIKILKKIWVLKTIKQLIKQARFSFRSERVSCEK
ncbi:MAG: radical SAM protein [Elusimicrobia bacterium]|nr:radical SAM protein [Elusimicrobiota bacterium]